MIKIPANPAGISDESTYGYTITFDGTDGMKIHTIPRHNGEGYIFSDDCDSCHSTEMTGFISDFQRQCTCCFGAADYNH